MSDSSGSVTYGGTDKTCVGISISPPRGAPERVVYFQNYRVVADTSCKHDRRWFDDLNLRVGADIYETHYQPEELGGERLVYDVIRAAVPRHAVLRRAHEAEPKTVPFLCSCHSPAVFGTEWPDLKMALGLSDSRQESFSLKQFARNIGVQKTSCLFPNVHREDRQVVRCIPIDLVPHVIGVFRSTNGTRTSRERNFSLVALVEKLHRSVMSVSSRLPLAGIEKVRLALFTEHADAMRAMMTVTYSEMYARTHNNDARIGRLETVVREQQSVIRELRNSVAQLRREMLHVRAAYGGVVDMAAKNASAIALGFGLVVPPPAVDVPTLAAHGPLYRRGRISAESFQETLDLVAHLVGGEAPRAQEIADVYLDLASRAPEAGPPDPRWLKAFEAVRALTGSQNPTVDELREAFVRHRKRRGEPHSSPPAKRPRPLDVA